MAAPTKVIAETRIKVPKDGFGFAYTLKTVETFERVYPSKTAAINNAREIGQTPLVPMVASEFNGYEVRNTDYVVQLYCEDVETGERFNYVVDVAVDHNSAVSKEEPYEYEAVFAKALALFDARGFKRVA